jgi:DNA-binding IclR family transcriptional regulator
MKEENEPRSIRAVERACNIINVVEEDGLVTVSTLTDRLDISKGTVSTYLSTLAREGYLVKTPDGYQLSLRYLSLSESVKSRIEVYDSIAQETTKIANKTGERAQFGMEEDGKAVIIYLAKGENAVTPSFSIGDKDYLHCIGLGKAMMSQFSRDKRNRILDRHGMPKFTENTIIDRETLHEELDQAREQGYAIDNEERIPGIRCVAVPVQMQGGEVLGAISVSGPAARMTDGYIKTALDQEIRQKANMIQVESQIG